MGLLRLYGTVVVMGLDGRGSQRLVPPPSRVGLTSLINMYNARSFLEEGKFVPAAQVSSELWAGAGAGAGAGGLRWFESLARTLTIL